MSDAQKYPTSVPPRFELRQGKFGPYFHDTRGNVDMPLERVLETLNRYALRQAQLAWYVTTFGDQTLG